MHRQLRKARRTLNPPWGGVKGYHKTEAHHARRRVDRWEAEEQLDEMIADLWEEIVEETRDG